MKIFRSLNKIMFILTAVVTGYWYFDLLQSIKESNWLAVFGSIICIIFSTAVTYNCLDNVLKDFKEELKEEAREKEEHKNSSKDLED